MALSGSLFSQTLQNITNTKLEELAKKRDHFEKQRKSVIAAAKAKNDPVEAIATLADGVKACFSVATDGSGKVLSGNADNEDLEISLKNLDRFLAQARYDPSVSTDLLTQWREALLRHLEVQSLKFSYATLYGHLTTEWLQSKQTPDKTTAGSEGDGQDFELLSGAKRMESRMNWEKSVFEAAKVDGSAITKMLEALFEPGGDEGKLLSKALKALRERVETFTRQLTGPGGFTVASVRWSISGLLGSDLLTDEKKDVLREFENNDAILREVADTLSMRISALDAWSFAGNAVQLEERRQLNGNFHIFMHEDLLDAIFLQYIGVKWSVFWKKSLCQFRRHKGVWQSPRKGLPLEDLKRREFFLGKQSSKSVETEKQQFYRDSLFLSQLLDYETQESSGVEGEQEADFEGVQSAQTSGGRTKQTARRAAPGGLAPQRLMASQQMPAPNFYRKSQAASYAGVDAEAVDYSDEEVGGGGEEDPEFNDDTTVLRNKNPMLNKQRLLHMLATDALIKTRIHGELTCFRSQVEHLYPTLPHATITAVFAFLGVPQKWLSFFQRFLQAPLRFMDEPSAEPRLRKRGTPGSHVLSEMFGEVVLFCLDFQVNQSTGGQTLWRLHDDLWFWSSKQSTCVDAWKAVTTFTKTVGLELNPARSGSARMQRPGTGSSGAGKSESLTAASVDPALPQGQIRWGMLVLDPTQGRFAIDPTLVKQQIDELGRQLRPARRSVFAWIQTWNAFASTFFTTNFGMPANCFGRAHVDNMLATHEQIQRQIFDDAAAADVADPEEAPRSVTAFLKHTIRERFGVTNIPDGYLFFPNELGGLELQSPFIRLLQVRDAVLEDPAARLEAFFDAERAAYQAARKAFEAGHTQRTATGMWAGGREWPQFSPRDAHTFMPFEEFTRHRETVETHYAGNLLTTYGALVARPAQESVEAAEGSAVVAALAGLQRQPTLRGILADFEDMEAYWRWVAVLYGPDVVERFGGMSIVDQGLLPIGMVSLFRSGRVKWQE